MYKRHRKKKFKKQADLLDDADSKIKGYLDDAGDILGGAGTGAIAGYVIGGLLGAVIGKSPAAAGAGASAGKWVGTAAGALLSALFKTGPKVQSIELNAQKLIEAITKIKNDIQDGDQEKAFLFDYNVHLHELIISTKLYNDFLSRAKSNSVSELEAKNSQNLISDLLLKISKVSDDAKFFNERNSRGAYQKYVSDSKIMSVLHEFFNDNLEDISDAIVSLNSAIAEYKKAINIVASEAKANEKSQETPIKQNDSKENDAKMKENKSQITDEDAEYAKKIMQFEGISEPKDEDEAIQWKSFIESVK